MCRASSLNRASSLDRTGVCGRTNFSGDRVGETFGLLFPSIIKLRSLTEEGCIDCMRRCEPPFMRDGTRALSRARSLSAACADWMALEVPAREVKPFGDCGLRGRGGGQRSGSELSHIGTRARKPRSEETDCWCLREYSSSRSSRGVSRSNDCMFGYGCEEWRPAERRMRSAPQPR